MAQANQQRAAMSKSSSSPVKSRPASSSTQSSVSHEEKTIPRPSAMRGIAGRPLNQPSERATQASTSAVDRAEIDKLKAEKEEWLRTRDEMNKLIASQTQKIQMQQQEVKTNKHTLLKKSVFNILFLSLYIYIYIFFFYKSNQCRFKSLKKLTNVALKRAY